MDGLFKQGVYNVIASELYKNLFPSTVVFPESYINSISDSLVYTHFRFKVVSP